MKKEFCSFAQMNPNRLYRDKDGNLYRQLKPGQLEKLQGKRWLPFQLNAEIIEKVKLREL